MPPSSSNISPPKTAKPTGSKNTSTSDWIDVQRSDLAKVIAAPLGAPGRLLVRWRPSSAFGFRTAHAIDVLSWSTYVAVKIRKTKRSRWIPGEWIVGYRHA